MAPTTQLKKRQQQGLRWKSVEEFPPWTRGDDCGDDTSAAAGQARRNSKRSRNMTKRSETQPVGHALDKKAEVIPSSTTDAMPETTSHHIHIVAGVVIALPQGPPMPEASSLAPKPTPTPVAGQKEEEKEGKEKEREEEKEGAEESDSVSEPGEETSDDEEEKEEEKKETETPEKPEEAKQPGQLEKPADAGYSERPESLPRPIGPWGPGGPGGPGRNEEADAGIGLGLIDPSGRLPPPKAEIASQTTTSPPAPTATGDDSDSDSESESSSGSPSPSKTDSSQPSLSTAWSTITTPSPSSSPTPSPAGPLITDSASTGGSFTTGVPPSTGTLTAPDSSVTADQENLAINRHGHTVTPGGEKALITLGSLGGAIILLVLAWLAWRSSSRSSARRYSVWQHNFFARDRFNAPRRAVNGLISKIPFLRSRSDSSDSNHPWANIDEKDADVFDEKKMAAIWAEPGQNPPTDGYPYGIVVQTTIRRKSIPGHSHSQSISSIQAQASHTLRPFAMPTANRVSDISSLSSGFGDGDIIAPPPAAVVIGSAASANASKRSSRSSRSSRKRDTVYTEASEDSPARFRTINSWVRQQSGRIRRAEQRDQEATAITGGVPPVPLLPPEQEFNLMMPDGEVPRRVEDTAAGGTGGHGVAQ